VPEAALKADDLEKHFGGLRAVAGVSLDVRRGELHAVIGPNGAGKSTLINLISGDLQPTSGTVSIEGVPVTSHGPARRALAGLGRCYQKTTIFPHASAFENVRLAAQAHAPRPLRMITDARRDPAVNARADRALAKVGLAMRAETIAGRLSHGEQRQLEIAMALATDPKILLLDEPFSGMGPGETQSMVALIAGLKQTCAVLLVEHDMDAVFALADRLTAMEDGRVIATGAPETVRAHAAVRAAYLGPDEALS
jgi:branched-chain amino acid transport system ATP-binding protein